MRQSAEAIGAEIRRQRLRAQMSQETLAAAIGCSKSHLSQMEAGLRTVSREWAQRIDHALGRIDSTDGVVAPSLEGGGRGTDERHGRSAATATDERSTRPLSPSLEERADGPISRAVRWHTLPDEIRSALAGSDPLTALRRIVDHASPNVEAPLPLQQRLPLINNIAAGFHAEFTDLGYPASVADEYIACPDVADADAFAARVIGASMEPEYRQGQIVVFSPALPTPDGSDCFVRLERDGETTFKRIFFEDGGRSIRLQPLNETYPPRVVAREEVAAMYAAAYVLRRVDSTGRRSR